MEVSLTSCWVSKYMYRGYDLLDDSGAWQPTVEISVGDSGVTLGWFGSYATGERDEDIGGFTRSSVDEHDYYAYWNGSPSEGVDVEVGFLWYDYLHLNSQADYWEGYGEITWSDLPFSPWVSAFYGRPKHEEAGGEGWSAGFGVSHSVALEGLTLLGTDSPSLDFSAETWYNDGQFGAEPAWSHAQYGVATTIALPGGLELTPGVYYQDSWEDTVNEEDEWWTTLSLTYAW